MIFSAVINTQVTEIARGHLLVLLTFIEISVMTQPQWLIRCSRPLYLDCLKDFKI